MADKTGIEWTDATWNPIVGCSIVSPGCTNCYAMKQAARIERMMPPERRGENILPHHYSALTQTSKAGPVWTGRVNLAPKATLLAPLRWKRPCRIFVNSMGDLFHEMLPDEWIDRVFAVMALAPQHVFQVLTKRAKRMREYCSDPLTPHRIAKAMDILRGAERHEDERFVEIAGYPGYLVSTYGRVLTTTGSATCVHCGRKISDKTAKSKYCSPRCRSNGQYRLRVGKPMLFDATPAEMSLDVGEDGHCRVMFYRDGQTVRELVHRLVLTAFDRPPVADEQGRHQDGDPSNNAICNLLWGDGSANWDDRRRHGNFRSYAKLSREQADEIKQRFARGETAAALGRAFGVSDTQARNIGEGRQWAVQSPIKWPLDNCWLGISAEDQPRANERIPDLLATPAAVRFVSYEPALGPIDFMKIDYGAYIRHTMGDRARPPSDNDPVMKWPALGVFQHWPSGYSSPGLDWIICGGESGPGARPMHPDWTRSARDQCAAAGVPFFFKQHGEFREFDTGPPPHIEIYDDSDVADAACAAAHRPSWITADGQHFTRRADLPRDGTRCRLIERVGKRAAGRLLDGVEHNAMPGVQR